ncbi:MAG: glycosyltransferase family 39 protein [Candidatus Altiarchaeota archaeon]
MAKKKKKESEESSKTGKSEEVQEVSSQEKLPGKTDLYIASGLFLIALLLRLRFLNAGLFYTDSVIAAQAAEATYNNWTLHYMHGVGYPGQVVMIVFFYALFKIIAGASTAEFATLFVSFFFASLTVGLIYLLVKKMGGSTFAAVSVALVLNTLPVYLSTSTFGMSHQPACFFIVLSFYLAMLASEFNDLRLKILASASLGWASAIRLESLMMFPLVLLFYWKNNPPTSLTTKEGYLKFRLTQNRDELLKDAAYLLAPMLLILLIPYYPLLSKYGFSTLVGAFEYNRWLGFWVQDLTETVIGWVGLSMTTLGWIMLFFGLVSLFFRKSKYIFLLVFVWCAYFLVLANTLTVEDRHTIPALIGFTIAIGFGLDWLYRNIHPIVGVAVLLILVGWMFLNVQPILEYRSGFCGPKSFAVTLRDTVEQNSVVIVMDEAPHLQYYGGLAVIGHPLDGNMVEINKSMAEINGYLNNGTAVYLVSSAFVYDTGAGLSYDQTSGTLYNANTKRIYDSIAFNRNAMSITDKSTGVSVGLYGIWQVELFSNFMVLPVKTVENEDWHKGNVESRKYGETIFKILGKA